MLEDGATEARERLLNQSDSYFQQAVFHLQTGKVPLEAQLLAVFDMQVSVSHLFDPRKVQSLTFLIFRSSTRCARLPSFRSYSF